VPWLKRLVAGLSPRTPGLIHMGFVVDKVALGQVFLRVLRFSPVSIIPPLLHIHLSTPHEVCDSSDQTAHYHHLGPKLGALSLTRHFGWKQDRRVKKNLTISGFLYLVSTGVCSSTSWYVRRVIVFNLNKLRKRMRKMSNRIQDGDLNRQLQQLCALMETAACPPRVSQLWRTYGNIL
jgi:hypothetical protein